MKEWEVVWASVVADEVIGDEALMGVWTAELSSLKTLEELPQQAEVPSVLQQ